MRLLLHRPLHKLSLSSSTSLLTGSKQLFNSTAFPNPFAPSSQKHQFHSQRLILYPLLSKPMSKTHPFCLKTNGYSYISHANVLAPAELENPEKKREDCYKQMATLELRLEELGIGAQYFTPGKHAHLLCPMCKGGDSEEKSLSLLINGVTATWCCFRGKCGWKGSTRVSALQRPSHETSIIVQKKREITLENLKLEPLCAEVTAYFAERMISEETLRRNDVMQCSSYKDVIAFTYRRNGLLVGCKYRTLKKRFWQATGSEKVLYGIDDINDADEIIIVEGEIDKLSLEEAGFCNSVSVPDGPRQKTSAKLPPVEKDTAYQYLWNCKEHLDKVSRIILATDNDKPGQALATEIARRLGTHRCWQVSWPKKDDFSYCKDANEVLKYMGPDALRKVIENAEPYQLCISNQVVQIPDKQTTGRILSDQMVQS